MLLLFLWLKFATADRIQQIESYKDSLLILTTQEGSLDQLRIKIEVIDLERNSLTIPVNLYGILLLVPRGHYTVGFLRPDTWYGIVFHSEQRVGGAIRSNVEHRLARTLNTNSSQAPPPFRTFDHREAINGRSVENVYLTAKWVVSEEARANFTELIVRSELQCDQGKTKKKKMILNSDEDEETIEIPLENSIEYDKSDNNTSSGEKQITAHINPKNCHKLCWASWLRAYVMGQVFSKEYNVTCSPIRAITAQSTVHGLSRHRMNGNELLIETDGDVQGGQQQQQQQQQQHRVGDDQLKGYQQADIQITAIPLGGKHSNEEKITARHRISTGISSNISLPKLEPARWYAIQYDDIRTQPFHYTNRERFLVNTMKSGGSNIFGNSPVLFEFAPNLASINVTKKGNDTRINLADFTEEFRRPPKITVYRNPDYHNLSIHFHYNPPCDTHHLIPDQFWLNDAASRRELTGLHLSNLLCYQGIGYFCAFRKISDLMDAKSLMKAVNYNATNCDGELCYRFDMMIEEELYETNEKICINVTEKYERFLEINGGDKNSLNWFLRYIMHVYMVLYIFLL